ncbi:glycerol-3-phosphate acyltransferase 1, mitochondrial [Protopterus annectens]|uniref:glycerol-3-phosphate acyltransferase 1, mitochondrial n=1 Tax=Protopterus annectens TaxID=7888 RepID=UPI001CFC2B0A|nr:glycerol-3-phosphate acyltransferase 1, mitochondrial [Protopterus annectens]XP_043911772.1 glycerol-3-phosphate acyltransferase 1, mitochondrial [Protopterus annectens]XP_043911773.1 glycerol-3-phosphate acyltransferase 1, mitochondrial [Protopterus annectens]
MEEAPPLAVNTDIHSLSTSPGPVGSRLKLLGDEWGERSYIPSVFRAATLKWKEAFLSRKRPFVGRCCHVCTPQSRDKLFNSNIPSLGLHNVIYINETHTRYRGWLARRLCYFLFVQERDVHKDMFPKNVVENVLNSNRVQMAIVEFTETFSVATSMQPDSKLCNKLKRKARTVLKGVVAFISSAFLRAQTAVVDASETSSTVITMQPNHKLINKVKKQTEKVLQEMVAFVSPTLLRLTGWVLLKLFNSFFWSIQIHRGQLEMVKAATELNAPLVFLPVHKSHIDYLLLTFILFCHNIKAPHIAAGNNLNIPIFSTLIRKLGGFFIRRRLDETIDGRKDVLYRAILHTYVEELLLQKQYFEIFLEGTRSRSGKTFPAKAGLLSMVVDTLCAGVIDDVLVIPVGISYDRIIEGNYNSEQLGNPKKNESLWTVARGVCRMLQKNYGCVRVDFAQPFSMKEYLDSQRQMLQPLSLSQTLLPVIIDPSGDYVLYEHEDVVVANARYMSDEARRRHVIATLAKHAMYTATKSCAVMSTHIVACLLLYRHRQGVDLSKLVEDFFSMKEEVLARDFDLGFSGNCDDVVMHALHLLGNCVTVKNTSRNNEFFIIPKTTIPAMFELNFYSNGILHVFIAEAIIACSLLAVLENMSSDLSQGTADGLISQEKLVHKAAGLCHLLAYEVAVALPCQRIYQVCHEAVERIVQYGVLLVAEDDQEPSLSPSEQSWEKKFPDPVTWRSDEEGDSDYDEEQRDRYLKISQLQEHKEFITFLQRLLGPLLEAYSSAAIFVYNFTSPVSETEYMQNLHKYLIARVEKQLSVYGECATLSLVKYTIASFKDLGVFVEKKEGRSTVLELSETFLPHENRQKLVDYILSFSIP